MLNFFKTNKNEAASRKSFDKMQQLLFDADSYMKAGHKDVSKALLHELVREAERNTDQIAEELYSVPPGECFFQDVDLCKGCGNGCEANQVQEVEFEHEADQKSQSFRSFMNDQHSIQQGECVSERGTDHCIHCVDHCQAKDYWKTKNLNPDPRRYEVQGYDEDRYSIYDTEHKILILQPFKELYEAEKTCAELNQSYIKSITPSTNG